MSCSPLRLVAPRLCRRGAGLRRRRRDAGRWRSRSTPLVSAQWLKAHQADPAVVVLDIRSAIDGGGAEAYAKAHIPGAVHSDYDKAGWRVTRNGVPFMLPTTAELEKLIGETGIDEDSHVVVVPAGVQRDRLRRGGARLLDAEDRRPSGGVDPRRRLRRLAGGGLSGRERQDHAVAENLHAKLDERLLAEVEAVERNEHATLVDARPGELFAGKEKAPAAKAYGHIPGAINLDSASFYDPATNRLRPKDAARRDRRGAAGRSGGGLLQHRPLGGDRLVRAVGGARPARRAALRRLDGRMDRRSAAARSPARARASTI